MKTKIPFSIFLLLCCILFPLKGISQNYTAWYNDAQSRIETLRKGNFTIKIIDKNGRDFSGPVAVRMVKHEYPFGIAFDFYEGSASMGNTFSTGEAVHATSDREVYQTERWGDYLSYAIPVESGKEYRLTLKFAEIYHGASGARLFDVRVEGVPFLSNFDVLAEAGGKNIAIDKSIHITPADNFINIELTAKVDKVAIKGIEITEVGSNVSVVRINCGGGALTTQNGNQYKSEQGYFDPGVNTVASHEQWMKAAMFKYFNYGVSGNSFKWSGIQPQPREPDYTNFDKAVAWTQKVGWELRAHTLLWGGYEYEGDHEMPRWVKDLPSPEAIAEACRTRIIRDMTRYKGIVKEYDVINEPLHATYLQSVVGESINWNSFKWARSADPDAELFINDYNVEYNWGAAPRYRDLILKIKEMGGPVTGVGMQAHYWDGFRVNVDELVRNVNIVAEAGLPIRFTEYDFAGNITEAQQAEDFIKVATVAFSHPSITGMISWGLSDKGAWREKTGYFDANYRPKLAADTLLYYTKTKWATNFDAELGQGGELAFNAYYGNYNIEVEFDGIKKVFPISCVKANKGTLFILNENEAIVKGPVMEKAYLKNLNTVNLEFDKPIAANSIKASDFSFFSSQAIGITGIQVDPTNSNFVTISLSAEVNTDNYVSVSYFPGTLAATDGSSAAAFGPEGLKQLKTELPTGFTNESLVNAITIFPNPADGVLNIEHATEGSFQVELFSILGVKMHSGLSTSNIYNLNVRNFNRGVYIVKVTDSKNRIKTVKVILN